MRFDRRNDGRASALPLHVLLSSLPSAHRALLARRVARLASQGDYDEEQTNRRRTI